MLLATIATRCYRYAEATIATRCYQEGLQSALQRVQRALQIALQSPYRATYRATIATRCYRYAEATISTIATMKGYRALQSALQSITESTQRVHRVSTQRANRVLLGSYIERLQSALQRAHRQHYIEHYQQPSVYWLGSEATASQLQWTVESLRGWPITTKAVHQQAISAYQSVIYICYCDQHHTIQHYSIFLLFNTCQYLLSFRSFVIV